jgi:hypothetical protein
VTALSLLLDVLDSYASYRINRSILASVIWSKFMLGLPVDDELCEHQRQFSRWVYTVDIGRAISGLHGCIAELERGACSRFRVYQSRAPLEVIAMADGGWSEAWAFTLRSATMILLPDVQRCGRLVSIDHRSTRDDDCPF